MRKLRTSHRPDVRAFDWQTHGTREPFAPMWGAASKLADAKAAAIAKAAEIDRSPNFTPAGRAAAKRSYLETTFAPLVKTALAAMDSADAEIARIRSTMTAAPIDKTDIAGALRRQEIRGWLRTLPDERRTAMLALPDQLEPEIAAAVIEQPAPLSGATEQQRARMTERAVGARYPKEAATISTLDAAVDALDFNVGNALAELGKGLGVPIADLVGIAPTLAERLSDITGDLPANAAAA